VVNLARPSETSGFDYPSLVRTLRPQKAVGILAIIKNRPHPNATKVFVNWLLGKEGQEVWTKSMSQPTRRRDVDTEWTAKLGSIAAKDNVSVERWNEIEQISAEAEATSNAAAKGARRLLPN
jgi:ABC-type Fe3+ transport system substrate-binding protein